MPSLVPKANLKISGTAVVLILQLARLSLAKQAEPAKGTAVELLVLRHRQMKTNMLQLRRILCLLMARFHLERGAQSLTHECCTMSC